jgi:hypothetical protein
MKTAVSIRALEEALAWVDLADGGNRARISRRTGTAHLLAADEAMMDDIDLLPEDVEDDDLYAELPDKHDLDLGQRLAMRFVRETMPGRAEEIGRLLHRRGGWRAFRAEVERDGQLDAWYRFSDAATSAALRGWAESEGFAVVD